MAALSAFVVASIVLVALMFSLSLAIATAQEGIIATIKAHVMQVKHWGGWVLMGVGLWLISLTIFANFFVEIFPV